MVDPITNQEIHYIESFIKVYPNKKRLYIFDNPVPIAKDTTHNDNFKKLDELDRLLSANKSIERSKTRISDYALCNNFDMFATFTFSDDRQNAYLCRQKMSKWLKNEQRNTGQFKYLIVPEYHKDGVSIHFHALLSHFNGVIEDSTIKQRGRKIYNIESYPYGFSTVVKIDNIDKVASYIKKYITKDMINILNKKRYWCSQSLELPTIVYNPNIAEIWHQYKHATSFKHVDVYTEIESDIIPK